MKTRVFYFDKYVKRRAKLFKFSRELAGEQEERLGRERPREPKKEQLLHRLIKLRREQLLKSGELKIIGPRICELTIRLK